MGSMENRRVLYQQIIDRGGGEEEESIPAPWRDTDQVELEALTTAPTNMAITLYGWCLAMQNRDSTQVYQIMTPAKREAFK
jgi:hypothetical protein